MAEERVLTQLSAVGLRKMPSRVLILKRLAETDGHLSAAEIHRSRGSEYAGVHLGTVHRGLEALRRAGLVHVVDDQGTQRFGLTAPAHLHAVCSSCGSFVEVPAAGLEPVIAKLAKQAGFAVDADGVVLHGLCAGCR